MTSRPLLLCGLLGALAAFAPPPASAQILFRRLGRSVAPIPTPTPTTADQPAPPAVLRWHNGETLSGEPVEGNDTALTWKTPLFEDALQLDWHALHRIDQSLPVGVPTTEGFRFTLRDGSHLYGELGAISAETVTVHSARCGDVALRRSEVLAARRPRGGQLVFDGPLGDAGWTAATADPSDSNQAKAAPTLGNVPAQLTGPGGALALPFWHRSAFLPLPLPPGLEVELRVRASKEPPAFQLAVEEGPGKQRLRVETWGDELVVAAGDSFESLRKIDPSERVVALRVCWDRQAKRCEVYTPEGVLLKRFTVPEETSAKGQGVRLQNKGRELSLDALRVRAWGGQPLPARDPAQGRVELDDGRIVTGPVSGADAGTLTIAAADGGSPTLVPLGTVDAVVFSNDAPAADAKGTTLAYADGTFLRGEIAGIKDGGASLTTTFTDAPLTARTGALRSLRLPGSDPEAVAALKSLDKIVVQSTTMHGHLPASGGESFLRWTSVGGTRSALPSRTLPVEVVRFLDPKVKVASAEALFHTRMGDVLPGALHGLDRGELDFDSPLVEAKKLPTGEWQAIQFNVSVWGTIQGFNSPGWQVVKKSGERSPATGDTLTLPEGSRAAHPAAMLRGEVKFSYDTTNFSFLRLRMFCDGLNPARSLNYVLYRSGNTISSGVEATEGEFSYRNGNTVPSGPVVVKLAIDEKGVRYYLNDNLVETLPFPAAKRAGSGLILEPAAMWGNQVAEVALSKFSASMEPGQSFFQDVNEDVRTQALTVPRFRKEDLPRHALLAANGDLLRGEVEAITNTQFGFRIGLETLRVPRDRVAAVVALQKPSDTPVTPDENGTVLRLLDRSMDQQMGYGSANFSTLIDVVKQAVPELKFKVPPEDASEGVQYFFSPKSVAATLDEICERFDLRYRVEKGTVVVEKKTSDGSEAMLRKPYWLSTDAFGAKDNVVDLLTAKGVAFPSGADARWQRAARRLEVTNSAANQDKIADVLAREFGGIANPPTHWLQLMNGGRLALTVEKFEAEAVVGTHPVYGRCTVPISEVRSIRNTLPDQMATGQLARGWQLAYAPEPVLPESGGEGSALLGKDAPAFKLALLEGGDFDLGEQKGRVVVLDFWATWCGPCIKSLPGLIETMSQFPADRVKLVGLNQAEAPAQVKRFLETRGWKLAVAMDAGQNVAQKYGVDGIPHTVIIGQDGKVAWVRTGADPNGDAAVAAEVKKLLATVPGTTTVEVTPGTPETAAR